MALIRKKLDGILATFNKVAADLDTFIGHARKDVDLFDAEAARITADRAAVASDIARAERTKAKLSELVA